MIDNQQIHIIRGITPKYPSEYNPPEMYPEYPFSSISKGNDIYGSVRDLLVSMGLDSSNYGTARWNPLGALIQPGQTVAIKPNFVTDFNPVESGLSCLITNGSIIRAILDYCFIALKGKGKIVICDAPLQSANFSVIRKETRLDEIQEFYSKNANFKIEFHDLRKIRCTRENPTQKIDQDGDPLGYTVIDLAAESCHAGRSVDFKNYRVTDYDPNLMNRCHNRENHQYLISNSLLSADVVINLPKLKTHRKAGFTCALKNMIGINCLKDYLPHHTSGSINNHGDEYLYKNTLKRMSVYLEEMLYRKHMSWKGITKSVALIRRILYRLMRMTAKDMFFEGSWYGNDTMWRTVLDLNRILFYANKSGTMCDTIQRNCFIVVDAIIAGEKEGPLEPTSKTCGTIIGGWNPVAVDFASAGLMGFDYQKIPQIHKSVTLDRYCLMKTRFDEITLVQNNEVTDYCSLVSTHFGFTPTTGWKDHIELNQKNCRPIKDDIVKI